MKIEWDEEKRLSNLAEHGVDFVDAREMSAAPMLVGPDFRKEYGALRLIGYGHIRGRCMTIAFTRRGEAIRVISLRKANGREQERFEKEIGDRLGSAGFHER